MGHGLRAGDCMVPCDVWTLDPVGRALVRGKSPRRAARGRSDFRRCASVLTTVATYADSPRVFGGKTDESVSRVAVYTEEFLATRRGASSATAHIQIDMSDTSRFVVCEAGLLGDGVAQRSTGGSADRVGEVSGEARHTGEFGGADVGEQGGADVLVQHS